MDTPTPTELKRQFSLRIKEAIILQIDILAQQELRTRTNMIEKLLQEALQSRYENQWGIETN